jgi:PAS domain S-box-containing protein
MDEVQKQGCEEALQKLREEFDEKLKERTFALARLNEEYLQQIELCKATERALKDSEEKYRLLIEEAGDVVYSSDFSGHFTYVNPACAKLTGYTQNELLGKHFSELISPEWKERVIAFYASQFRDKKTETLFSFPMATKSGKEKWVEQTVVQLCDGEKITGYRSIVRDISERKAAEGQLIQKSEELEKNVALLEAANKELESFSYSISHDLRAPIRAINSFASILQKKYTPALGKEGTGFLVTIIRAAKRMGALVDGLLGYIRIGQREVKMSKVDMAALAKAVINEAAKREGKTNIKFVANELPPIKCDSFLMRQVFANLLSNAIKYSKAKPDPIIEIGAADDGGMVTYYVKDNGVGFDMQYYHKLFEVFQQLHTLEDYTGTGIGLATVKKIVSRHGGKVWAEGKVGEGATFYISLPNV